MPLYPTLKKGIAIANRGVAEDKKKNYEEAVKFYDECQKYFLHAAAYELKDKIHQIEADVMATCYKDRANELKKHLRQVGELENVEKMENLLIGQ